jgi:hypothetical protein
MIHFLKERNIGVSAPPEALYPNAWTNPPYHGMPPRKGNPKEIRDPDSNWIDAPALI